MGYNASVYIMYQVLCRCTCLRWWLCSTLTSRTTGLWGQTLVQLCRSWEGHWSNHLTCRSEYPPTHNLHSIPKLQLRKQSDDHRNLEPPLPPQPPLNKWGPTSFSWHYSLLSITPPTQQVWPETCPFQLVRPLTLTPLPLQVIYWTHLHLYTSLIVCLSVSLFRWKRSEEDDTSGWKFTNGIFSQLFLKCWLHDYVVWVLLWFYYVGLHSRRSVWRCISLSSLEVQCTDTHGYARLVSTAVLCYWQQWLVLWQWVGSSCLTYEIIV